MFRDFIYIPILIGLVTGIFALSFIELINLITSYVLEGIVGYHQPIPHGEGGRPFEPSPDMKLFLLPLTVGIAGLISGILTHLFSPESAGVGTDSAIRAYHTMQRLSLKSSVVKLITSALTIGSGGTSGREGPIALIGAGAGSTVANFFAKTPRDRRIYLAVGLGAGISAIFKAPLAGAIISAEVFFKKDFEIRAMIPAFIASVVSYSVFCAVHGFKPIFSLTVEPLSSHNAHHLLAYAGLGIFCALLIRTFVFTFFKVKSTFDRLPLKPYLRPAIGGFLAGIVAMFSLPAIGNGYGWLQMLMNGEYLQPLFLAIGIIGVALGVSLTLGSGMSGGIFGPSVMIGGLAGALYSVSLNSITDLSLSVPSFMVVGMVSLFGGAAKAPLSTLILIAEMTGGYQLLVPAMVSVLFAYILSGDRSIFPSQVPTRIDSPAHIEEWGILALEKERVRNHMKVPITVSPQTSLPEILKLMSEHLIGGIPVVEDGRLVGIVTRGDVMGVSPQHRDKIRARHIMTRNPITVTPEDTLADCLRIMMAGGIGRLPVVEDEESRKLVGIIARADIGRAIRRSRF